MKKIPSFIVPFVFSLLFFALLVLLFVLVSISFISHLAEGGKLFSILDSQLFNTIIIQNSIEYLAFVIGLPLTILIALIALSLAFMSWKVSISEAKREAQLLIKNKRDEALAAFLAMALAVNRLVTHGSSIADNLQEVRRRWSDRRDEIEAEDIELKESNLLRRIEEIDKRKAQSYRQELLRLCEVLESDTAPAIGKVMSNAICNSFFIRKGKLSYGSSEVDAWGNFFYATETAKDYVRSLSDGEVIKVVEAHAQLSWSEAKPDTDRATLLDSLYPPLKHPSWVGMLVVASIMRPRVEHRLYNDDSSEDRILAKTLAWHLQDLESSEFDHQFRILHYLGPATILWLISCFPSLKDFKEELASYFGKTVSRKYLVDIGFDVGPDQFILKEVADESTRLKDVIGYRRTKEGLIGFERQHVLVSEFLERTHQVKQSGANS